jgi:hypothetical protein
MLLFIMQMRIYNIYNLVQRRDGLPDWGLFGVDLGIDREINVVQLANRRDCCSEGREDRLTNQSLPIMGTPHLPRQFA